MPSVDVYENFRSSRRRSQAVGTPPFGGLLTLGEILIDRCRKLLTTLAMQQKIPYRKIPKYSTITTPIQHMSSRLKSGHNICRAAFR